MTKKHKKPENHTTTELPSAFSLFRPSYSALMTNIWTFLGLLGIPLASLMLAGLIGGVANNATAATNTGLSVFALVIVFSAVVFAIIAAPSMMYVQLKSVRQEVVSIGEALRIGAKYFWRFWGLSLLVGLIILGGFLLFIIPGFFMLRRYILAPYYLYDKNLGIL